MRKTSLMFAVAPAALLVITAFAQDQTLQQTYQAHRLQVDAFIGNMKIDVVPGSSGISVSLSGSAEMVQLVRLSTSGDAVVIAMDGSTSDWWSDMWDWSSVSTDDLTATITVPPGTPVKVDNFIGDATVGDLKSTFDFSTSGGDVKVGEVTAADVSIAGSGDITLGTVTGNAEIEIAGSGSVRSGNTLDAKIDIAGGGDVTLGVVNGMLEIDIAGSGEVVAQSVDGRVDIDVAGSGDVTINGGRADPFKVDIAGSGAVKFAGTANNPDVSVMGSGDVWIASYTGTLSSAGADIKVGQAQ